MKYNTFQLLRHYLPNVNVFKQSLYICASKKKIPN